MQWKNLKNVLDPPGNAMENLEIVLDKPRNALDKFENGFDAPGKWNEKPWKSVGSTRNCEKVVEKKP